MLKMKPAQMLDYKKLLNWKIGYARWEVVIDDKFPVDPKIPKDEQDADEAFCDVNKKVIFMRKSCVSQGPQMFLDVLFHELVHAMDSDCAIDHQLYMSDVITRKEQRIELQELNTELRSAAWLRFLSDNPDNMAHIISYLQCR